jgi:hypothetical protein
MTAVLRGTITRLVRRETREGIVFEFWVATGDGGGPARAIERIGLGFREGDSVEVQGNRDQNGVLDASTMTRLITNDRRSPWLCAPRRWLYFAIPAASWVAMNVVSRSSATNQIVSLDVNVFTTRPAPAPEWCIGWGIAGLTLLLFAQKRVRNTELRWLLQAAASVAVLTALAIYSDNFDIVYGMETFALLLSIAGAALVAALMLYERVMQHRQSTARETR